MFSTPNDPICPLSDPSEESFMFGGDPSFSDKVGCVCGSIPGRGSKGRPMSSSFCSVLTETLSTSQVQWVRESLLMEQVSRHQALEATNTGMWWWMTRATKLGVCS